RGSADSEHAAPPAGPRAFDAPGLVVEKPSRQSRGGRPGRLGGPAPRLRSRTAGAATTNRPDETRPDRGAPGGPVSEREESVGGEKRELVSRALREARASCTRGKLA